MQITAKKRYQRTVRTLFLVLVDIFLINLSNFLTLLMLKDFNFHRFIMESDRDVLLLYSLIVTVVTILIFFPFKLYNSLWEFAGPDELIHILTAGGIVLLLRFIFNQIPGMHYFVIAFPIISGVLLIGFVGASRLLYRK